MNNTVDRRLKYIRTDFFVILLSEHTNKTENLAIERSSNLMDCD